MKLIIHLFAETADSTMAKLATAASKGKLHVLRLDSGPFCVDGAKVGFL